MSDCLTPVRLPLKGLDGYVLHDCGKCYACQNNSRGEWALRAREEVKHRPYLFFLTLTYDNENLKKYCFNVRYNKFLKKYVNFNFDYNTGEVGDLIHDVDVDQYMFQQSCVNFMNRRWDYALLRKDHLQQFLKDVNEKYSYYFPYMYYNREYYDIKWYYMGNSVTFFDPDTIIIKGEKYPLCNHLNGLYYEKGRLQRVRTLDPQFKEVSKMKYYATGEYGDTTHRPHY